ncbi:hypothetical protein Pla110_15900 [Polystyrenella longa]|uniref:Uncharacterized protein n=1 Tax=Polystyrenella longa TaxID=2528007 RepID=A0A518CKW9_9PLAN|nr:hypothetical protein [Polystyrenella longa]QDU79871.1 hypothetical protein Pla110_15900 [Polystyrenella longa]
MKILGPLRELDQILRGEKTKPESLRRASLEISLGQILGMIVFLGLLYGLCMSVFSMTQDYPGHEWQIIASMVKVPALFLLTLLITFPSLYVFNALVGSRFEVVELLRLLIASLGVALSMLGSLGLIVAFFSVSTTSYSFMILLNVFVFSVSGFLGLKFLLQTLHRMSLLTEQEETESSIKETTSPVHSPTEGGFVEIEIVEESSKASSNMASNFSPKEAGPLAQLYGPVLSGEVKTVFRCWIVVFGLVGAQMSWILRPFIGDPNSEFAWFRPRGSSFFEAVYHTFLNLFS